ncbi:hypothetical protein [Roseomonas sp. 18066]|uniref:hypothetical protein n=1 Tax=Roseomonas sp. 18066 TaxID=2681412 RepID=UPI00135C40FD|nr:hypothetical protein [Roseomonas sp. 18066]
MASSVKVARATIDALVLELEALVAGGCVLPEEVFDLLHRAIDHLPVQDRCILRPEAEKVSRGRRRMREYPKARPHRRGRAAVPAYLSG